MNSNSKGRTSLVGGRPNRNSKNIESKVVREEVNTVVPQKLNQEAATTLASKVQNKPVAIKVAKEEVKPVVTKVVKEEGKHVVSKAVKEEVKRVVSKAVKEETEPKTSKVVKTESKKPVKTETKKSTKTENKKPAKTETKKQDAFVASEVNYKDVLGDAEIKVIELKDKKSVANFKINVVLKNLNFCKIVRAVFTEDSWETTREVDLKYISSDENDIENWGTKIKIDPKKVESFQYAVSYDVNGIVYWDNNDGNDYRY